MKAIIIREFGGAHLFEEAELPDPIPSRDEVQIQIRAIGFNPVDVKIRSGLYQERTFPLVLGADCSGIVTAVGNPLGRLAVGDEVVAFAFGKNLQGTYAESISLPHQFVVKKPKQLSFEQAAGAPLVSLTAFQALIPSGALQQGRSIFIPAGAGGVGSIAISLARAYGAAPIFTTAGSEKSVSYLMKTHALARDKILLYHGKTLSQQRDALLEMNGGKCFSCCFDTVGHEMKKLCFEIVDFYGHVVTILPEEEEFDLPIWGRKKSLAFQKSLSLHFVFLGSYSFHGQKEDWAIYKEQLEHLMHLFEKKEIVFPPPTIIGDFSVETVRKAHKILESKHTKGKLIMQLYSKP